MAPAVQAEAARSWWCCSGMALLEACPWIQLSQQRWFPPYLGELLLPNDMFKGLAREHQDTPGMCLGFFFFPSKSLPKLPSGICCLDSELVATVL